MDEPKPSRSLFRTVLRLIVLVVILAAAFAGYMHFYANQRAGRQQVYDNLEVLNARLQNLENSIVLHEKRLKDLEDTTQKLANAPQQPIASQAAQPPLTTQASSPTPSGAPVDERIAGLEREIAAMKSASPMQDSAAVYKSIRVLSALHRLSDRVIGGKPFATELTAFEEAAGPEETSGSPLATLAPYADSGIPTFATLLVTFDQAVESLNAAEAVPPANASFWQRFVYNIKHLVSVRRIDEAQTGSSVNAIVGRAQAHLEREEIEAAVAEIKSLPENMRGNFAAWLDDAQTVTDAPSLIEQMEENVMQKAFGPSASAPAGIPSAPAASPAPPASETQQPAAPAQEQDNSSSPKT